MGIVSMIARQAAMIACLLALMLPLACCGGPGMELPPSEREVFRAARA